MKDAIYRYSILGIPIGLLGFVLEIYWIRCILFFFGGTLCMFGWVIGMEIQGQRTVAKKTGVPGRLIDNDPFSPDRSRAHWVAYVIAMAGLLGGLFGLAVPSEWLKNSLLAICGTSCCALWYLDGRKK